MKFRRLRTALLALICGTSVLQADILIMKDGSKIEGNILEETPDAIRMRYRLTPKIWDEKAFPRADIEQVVKQSPQEVELIELRKLLPTADLLTADQYEQIIQDRLRPFVNKYKGTPEAGEAEKIIEELQAEKMRVANGELKLEGKWLSAKDAKREAYNIGAYKILVSMKEKAAKQDWVGALREFDKISVDKSNARPASTYYPEAIKEAKEILARYEPIISKMIVDQPEVTKTRDEGLKKLVDPDLSRTKAAIKSEADTWKAAYDAEKKAGVRWLIPNKYDVRSLQDAQKTIVAERTRLEAYDLDLMRTQNEALMGVVRALTDENPQEAMVALERGSKISVGPNKDYPALFKQMRDRVQALRVDLAKRQAQAGIATSGSSAIGGTETASVDDRVARILAEESGTAAPAPMGAPPGTITQGTVAQATAAPGTIAQGGPAPAPTAVPGTVLPTAPPAPVQPRPAPPVAAATPPAPVAAVAPAEESNFQTYLLIGAGALIALLLLALLQQKKKKEEEEA